LLREITPIGVTALARVDMPGQGMPWLALEHPATDPEPEGRISELIQDKDRIVDPSE